MSRRIRFTATLALATALALPALAADADAAARKEALGVLAQSAPQAPKEGAAAGAAPAPTSGIISASEGAPVANVVTVPPPGALNPEVDPVGLVTVAFEAVVQGNWWLAAGLALWLVVWFARRTWGERWPFLSTLGGQLLSTVVFSVLAGVVHGLLAGQAPSMALLLTALKAALTATIPLVVNHLQHSKQRKAEEAAREAAAAIGDSREKAVDTLTGAGAE